MIKKVPAIQISDGRLFLDPEEAKKAEFALLLQTMMTEIHPKKESDPDVPFTVVNLDDLVANKDALRKVLDEATNIVVGAQAL